MSTWPTAPTPCSGYTSSNSDSAGENEGLSEWKWILSGFVCEYQLTRALVAFQA